MKKVEATWGGGGAVKQRQRHMWGGDFKNTKEVGTCYSADGRGSSSLSKGNPIAATPGFFQRNVGGLLGGLDAFVEHFNTHNIEIYMYLK